MTNKMIPYGKQYIDQDDIDAVINTLKSDFLTQGPKITEFEKAFANYVESEHAIAVNNGTSALHLCALALGVKSGDKVICPTITFTASANCIEYCGGEVIFCDTFLIVLNAPWSPKVTSLKSLSLPTQVKIYSASLAASAGVSAILPLYSPIHFSAFDFVRLKTVTL